jgi:hypothetical protein
VHVPELREVAAYGDQVQRLLVLQVVRRHRLAGLVEDPERQLRPPAVEHVVLEGELVGLTGPAGPIGGVIVLSVPGAVLVPARAVGRLELDRLRVVTVLGLGVVGLDGADQAADADGDPEDHRERGAVRQDPLPGLHQTSV